MLGRPASSSSHAVLLWLRSCRQLEQIDDVGENDQAYDGKEHQNENIQHDGVLGREASGLQGNVSCEHGGCRQWREMAPSSLHCSALVSPLPLQGRRLRDAAIPSAAHFTPPLHTPPPANRKGRERVTEELLG